MNNKLGEAMTKVLRHWWHLQLHHLNHWWNVNEPTCILFICMGGFFLYVFRYAILIKVFYWLCMKPFLPKQETEKEMESRIAAEVHAQLEDDMAEITHKHNLERATTFAKESSRHIKPERN